MLSSGRRVVALACVVVLAVAALATAHRLQRVHDYGWEWTLWPSAAPPKVYFAGRDYRRGRAEAGGLPDGYVQRGMTLGGGRIYQDAAAHASVVIYVSDGDRIIGYGLLGGP